MRIEQFLEASAARSPDKVAVVAGKARVTFDELRRLSNRMANALLAAGLDRGDRVAIFLDNSVEAVASLFGTLKAGGVYTLINTATKASKLGFILRDLEPRFMVAQSHLAPVCDEALALNQAGSVERVFVVGGDGGPRHASLAAALDSASDAAPPCVGIDLDLAYVIYTSGSTGLPKGVMMTHRNSVSGATSMMKYLGVAEDDVVLSVVPMSFDYGMYQVIMGCAVGGTVVLERSLAFPHLILRKMAEECVTGLPVVPTTASILLGAKGLVPGGFPHMRYITNTAAPLPPAHSARLMEVFPGVRIFSNYGLTENIRGTFLPPEQILTRPTSVGKAMPNTEAWVANEHGHRVGPGVVGELILRGANLFLGYWRNPEATDRVLRPGPYPWERVFHTGDLFLTDDEGYLYFQGRTDDIIKTRGEKVSPKEIENLLYSLEGIREAAVVGIPDPVVGMAIKAVVALREGSTLIAQEIQRHCAKHLEDFMVPSLVEIRDELPKTESGKIRKMELREAALDPAPGPAPIPA